MLAFFTEAVDSVSEVMAVLGAAVRNVMGDIKGTFTPGRVVAFCPYQARHTAQFVPYLFSTAAIFFKTASELFHGLLGVKCKCTTSKKQFEMAAFPVSLSA